jgi:tetraacyldisaccharide 4'-kinase
MSVLHDLGEKIRRGDPIPAPLSALLHAATPVTRWSMQRRLNAPRVRVDAHVVSIGNLTAGGTGKTPAVIERAQQALQDGHKVAVLTRGYRAASSPTPVAYSNVPTDGDAVRTLGDEPLLILRKVPGVVVVKCADRVAGAHVAIDRFGCDTLILDDGFQYVRLERDENVVLIDATNPFGNGYLLPRGVLREPVEALARATEVMLTRCDQVEDPDAIADEVHRVHPTLPIRKTWHAPSELWRVADGSASPLTDLNGKAIHAACAIGNPEAFLKTLESLGAKIVGRQSYPDHAPIPLEDLPSDGMIAVTEKDAVRMPQARENVWALGIALADLA